MCNVVYKIIAKVLANRLKVVLHGIISDEQVAFVEGRSIIDNVMVAFKVTHHMKRNTSKKRRDVALKIDMGKAYDRMDWGYLRQVMLKMDFDGRWVNLIMLCVTTVHYSVIVNDQQVGPIYPERGLRQGDPLSPYLFIIYAEGLSSLIKDTEKHGYLHGIKICRGAPVVSHLLFANDSFLFF